MKIIICLLLTLGLIGATSARTDRGGKGGKSNKIIALINMIILARAKTVITVGKTSLRTTLPPATNMRRNLSS